MDIRSEFADSAISAVRFALSRISCGFPESAMPQLNVSPPSRLAVLPKQDPVRLTHPSKASFVASYDSLSTAERHSQSSF